MSCFVAVSWEDRFWLHHEAQQQAELRVDCVEELVCVYGLSALGVDEAESCVLSAFTSFQCCVYFRRSSFCVLSRCRF